MIEYTDYRLAFILPHSRQLLGIPGPGAIVLPAIRIPLWQRSAEQLTRQIEERWKIKSIILDTLPGVGTEFPCAVVEVQTGSWDFESEGFNVVQPESVSDFSLAEIQRRSLKAILSESNPASGPFSRIGWIEDARQWIQSSVDDHNVVFTDEICQLNGGGAFCLIRLATQSGPAYWLKGVGEPNFHEFAVTGLLARHCPEYLPRVVAMRSDWNAWAMEEFGASLNNSRSLDDFKCAASRLGNLQKRFVGRSRELLAVQCSDHRAEALSSHIDEIIDYLDEAMHRQTTGKVEPLSTSRLHEIRGALHDGCFALQELHIPDSLIHNDISPGSILASGTNCVFTDWCEACVGNPFLTFEQLCVHAARKTDEPQSWIRILKSVYRSCWMDIVTDRQIDRALHITPLISVLSYLYGRGDWLSSLRRFELDFLSYTRSLARHMDRIARRPELKEALCRVH
jgi:hypothetical protein